MDSVASRVVVSIEAPPNLQAIYEQSAEFVWLTLQRLGVRYHDLDDLCHDVFLIAHRKLAEFDGRTKIQSWLFGICLRVAANYRRRAYIRLEQASGAMEDDDDATFSSPSSGGPHETLVRREAQKRATDILDRMDLAKRAVFVMFEIEGIGCQEIATELGVPVGTVYSRLHAARQFFAAEVQSQRDSKADRHE
jgi:RNA polymerase sigma-70 factor (ECF subfamily)